MSQGFTNNSTNSIPLPLAVSSGGTGVTTSTGTGSVVLSNSPTLVTPALGTPTSGVLTNATGYTVANLADAAWTDWSGSIGFTGFSANPTVTSARYKKIGNTCFIAVTMTNGTSNANTFTITGLPFTSVTGINQRSGLFLATDNSIVIYTCDMNIPSASTTITVRTATTGTGWTASGSKGVAGFQLFYETA